MKRPGYLLKARCPLRWRRRQKHSSCLRRVFQAKAWASHNQSDESYSRRWWILMDWCSTSDTWPTSQLFRKNSTQPKLQLLEIKKITVLKILRATVHTIECMMSLNFSWLHWQTTQGALCEQMFIDKSYRELTVSISGNPEDKSKTHWEPHDYFLYCLGDLLFCLLLFYRILFYALFSVTNIPSGWFNVFGLLC